MWVGFLPLAASAAPYERPAVLPKPGVASDAHRADPRGAYGGLKSRRGPLRAVGDVRDTDRQPYAGSRAAPLSPRTATGGPDTGRAWTEYSLHRKKFRILEQRPCVPYIRLTPSTARLVLLQCEAVGRAEAQGDEK
jgi:hypothetical protein